MICGKLTHDIGLWGLFDPFSRECHVLCTSKRSLSFNALSCQRYGCSIDYFSKDPKHANIIRNHKCICQIPSELFLYFSKENDVTQPESFGGSR